MYDVKSYKLLFILIIAFAAGCFYLGNVYAKYTIKVKVETSDTTYIEKKIVIRDSIPKLYPKIDTVFITKNDSLSKYSIERLDTTLYLTDRDTFTLRLDRYEYPALNYKLSYNFIRSDETKIIKEKVLLEESKSFINNFSIGLGAGYSIVYSNQEFKLQPSVNLSVYYKLF